jgi:iron complex transport system ATP-binding protein
MTDPIRVENLSCAIGGAGILSDVSLSVAGGEFVALVGPNGAGKTTLLRCIAGLIRCSGQVLLEGGSLGQIPIGRRARMLAFLPQGHVFHWPLPVRDIVALGRLPQSRGADLSSASRDAVDRAMESTGIMALADRPVTTLSGGERARVALSRVLATEAPILLADEPTASLDPHYQLEIGGILKRHAQNGGAVLAVLHDLALAARFADRMAVLSSGRMVTVGAPGAVLTRETLAEAFGVQAEIVEVGGVTVPVPFATSGVVFGKGV